MNGKRVLFFTSSAPQSASDSTATFILSMAQDLKALGYEVDVLAPHAPGIATDEVISGVRVQRFRYFWPSHLQTLCAGGSTMVNLRKNKLNALLLPFLVLFQAIALTRLMKRGGYDILHSHWLLPQGLIGGWMAKRHGAKHVLMVHGADIFGLKHPFFRWLKRIAIRSSDVMIANSRYTKAEIESLQPHLNIHVIPTGTTPMQEESITPADRSQFADSNTKLIVFLGRLIEEKGLHFLLEALPLVKHPCKLLVIGDGADRAVLEAIADERTHFIGAVPHARIYDYLSIGDAFVAPSISMPSGWVEAQGNSIIEAMFAGLPVIASDIGGIPDSVIHEKTGVLVQEKDPKAIAEALDRLFDDSTLYASLTAHAKAHAEAHFSRTQTAQKIAALYAN